MHAWRDGRGCSPTPLTLPCAAQRAHDAAAGRAPASCASCDAHMRAVLRGGRARGGCDLEALLAQLPLGGVASRAWSMRLGAQLLELAATDFSGADTGHAPVAAWAAAAEAAGAAARPELPTHAACCVLAATLAAPLAPLARSAHGHGPFRRGGRGGGKARRRAPPTMPAAARRGATV